MKTKKFLISFVFIITAFLSLGCNIFAVGETDRFYEEDYYYYYVDSNGNVNYYDNTSGFFGLWKYSQVQAWTSQSIINKLISITSSLGDISYDTSLSRNYLYSINNKMDSIYNVIDGVETYLYNIQNYVDGLEGYVDGLEGYVDGVEGYIDGVESSLTDIKSSTDRITASNGFLANILSQITNLNSNIDGVEGFVDGVESGLADIKTSTDRITSSNGYLASILNQLSNLQAANGWLANISNKQSAIHNHNRTLSDNTSYTVAEYLDYIATHPIQVSGNINADMSTTNDILSDILVSTDNITKSNGYLANLYAKVNTLVSNTGWLNSIYNNISNSNSYLSSISSANTSTHSSTVVSHGNSYTVAQYLSSLNNLSDSIITDLVYVGDTPSDVYSVADLIYSNNIKLDQVITLLSDIAGNEDVDNTQRDSVIDFYNDLDFGDMDIGDMALELPTFDIAIIIPDLNVESTDFPFAEIAGYTAGYFSVSANTGGW